MTICLHLCRVNWENRQIYKNCKYCLMKHARPSTRTVFTNAFLELCPGRFLSGNRISTIHTDDLPKNLITLELRGNPLGNIKFEAFQNMSRLRKLCVNEQKHDFNDMHILVDVSYFCFGSRVLSDAKSLSELPSLEGCSSLEILRMDRANISLIPNSLCRNSSRLKSL